MGKSILLLFSILVLGACEQRKHHYDSAKAFDEQQRKPRITIKTKELDVSHQAPVADVPLIDELESVAEPLAPVPPPPILTPALPPVALIAFCGDGIEQPPEECDDGDDDDGDGCDKRCRVPDCGNATIEGNEECDAPGSSSCNDDCRLTERLKVMTRNLYLGADLTPAILATDLAELRAAGTTIWNTILATDFPARAQVLAQEIANVNPDIIGLQEVMIFRSGVADGPPSLGGTPANTIEFDYLDLLLDELEAAGKPYVVIHLQNEADIESVTNSGFDIRLTSRDVIIANKKKVDDGVLECTNKQAAHFPDDIQLTFNLAGGIATVETTRGYVSADCKINDHEFRLVNTHLESFSATIRAAQAAFLGGQSPASTTELPVVLVGDLNSDPLDNSATPPDPTLNNAAINALLNTFDFIDTWTEVNGNLPGLTFGFSELLNDADASGFTLRIDHVLTRPEIEVLQSIITGTNPENRTNTGLWPSDHAGVVTTFAL